jgi:hypothetical protein
VTASIQPRAGSSPPHSEWSQSPPVIHVPGETVAANARMRATNSSRDLASRSCTEARRNPPSMKWTWASMKPGTTSRPAASSVAASGTLTAAARTSSFVPTWAMRSPAIAIASAQGRSGSPVQMRPLTTIRVSSLVWRVGIGTASVSQSATPATIAATTVTTTTNVRA